MPYGLQLIFDILIWVIVPALLVLALLAVYFFSKRLADKKYQHSTQAGFWAGFFLFTIVFTYQVGGFLKDGFPNEPIFQGLNLWAALGAGAATFGVSLGCKKILPRELAGWIVLLLSFALFYVFFHYLFIRTLNKILLSIILGAGLGISAYIASSPAVIKQFLEFLKAE